MNISHIKINKKKGERERLMDLRREENPRKPREFPLALPQKKEEEEK